MERPSLSTINARIAADMETRLTSDTPILRKSFLGVLKSVFASAIHLCYGFVVSTADNLLPDTADDEWLKRLAVSWGVTLKSLGTARGNIQVIAPVDGGGTVYAGTIFDTPNGVEFESVVNQSVVAGGSAIIEVQAVVPGTSGNVDYDTMTFQENQSGDFEQDCPVTSTPTGGSDEEDIEELRSRVLNRFSNRPSSGSEADLEFQARSVDGVSYVWVLPAEKYTGAGAAGVVVAADNKIEVSDATLALVQSELDANEVVGATITALKMVESEITISVSTSVLTENIETTIKQNLAQVVRDNAKPREEFKISDLRDAISAALPEGADYFIETMTPGDANNRPNSNLPALSGFGEVYVLPTTNVTVTQL